MRVVFATACSPDGRSPQSCGRPRGVMRAGLLVRVLERAVHTDRGRRPPRPGREVSGASGGHSATRPAPAAGRSPLPRGGHFTGPTLRHFVYSRAGPARESPILPSLRSVQELGTRLKTTRRWRRPLPTTRGRRPRGLTRFKRAGGHGRCGRALRLLNHREGERGVAGRRTERSIRDEPAGSGLLRLANAERAVGLYVFDPPSASRASRG